VTVLKTTAAASGRRTGTGTWRKERALPVSRGAKPALSSRAGEWEEDCRTHRAGKNATAGTPDAKQSNRVMLERQVFILKLHNSLALKTSRKPLIHDYLEL